MGEVKKTKKRNEKRRTPIAPLIELETESQFRSSLSLSLSFSQHLLFPTLFRRIQANTMGKEVAGDAMDVENVKPGDDKKASLKKDAIKAASKPPPPPSVLEAAAMRDVRALPARALRLAAAARARVTGADVLAFSREVLSSSSSSDALAEIVSALQQVRKKGSCLWVSKPPKSQRTKRGSSGYWLEERCEGEKGEKKKGEKD